MLRKGAGMAVLSIQSHVVFGHAGNSAAVFPLQQPGRMAAQEELVSPLHHFKAVGL
jgi:pyridoxal/pyridoxine/pyridoxamine kinase